jgi:2-iminobutanoate/2-iminopropanoate deaminase
MPERERIDTPGAPTANGHYSNAIAFGDLVFCAGQTPVDPKTGNIVEGPFEAQVHQSLKNLAVVLEAAGSSLAQTLKTTVFLKDMNNIAVMNEIYRTYFPDPPPARSTIEVARLPKDSQVEIELVAVRTRKA